MTGCDCHLSVQRLLCCDHVDPHLQVRTASWLWNFYRKIYNICTCDWSRMHDWPAEQVWKGLGGGA